MKEVSHPRTIRSFVRRAGRITPGQQTALSDLWKHYGLEISSVPLDFEKIFGRIAPLHLEIGFGMGDALFEMALEHPEINYLGIEVHKPGCGKLLSRIQEHDLKNIRIFSEDAVTLLKNSIAENSLDKIYILFPDPWHKKRHQKRRLIQPEFVALLCNRLKPDGIIHAATDWDNYAHQMQHVFDATPTLTKIPTTPRPQTKYERRAHRLAHVIHDFVYQKKQ